MTFEPPLVLVAEADPALRAAIATALRARGLRVGTAADATGLAGALSPNPGFGRPALVATTMALRGMTLREICELAERESGVHFVLIVDLGNDEQWQRAHASGALAVLEKPFDLEELGQLIEEALGRGWREPGFPERRDIGVR